MGWVSRVTLLGLGFTTLCGCGRQDPAGPSNADSTGVPFSGTVILGRPTRRVVYTCDGAGYSPPLAWSGAPAGTVQFAMLMTTLANDGMKWNWVMYGIPASATALAEGGVDVGTFGLTSDGPDLRYYPPCSQGPSAKTYTFTIYALSAAPVLSVPAGQVSGAVLTSAISSLTLDSSRVSVTYTR